MANNESKVVKNNTLEQWRQKTNEVSHHLGDVDQLDSRLTDKVYTYSSTSESSFSVFDNDASSKNLRFELKPEEAIDAPATIILTGSPTIPSSFLPGIIVYQGSSGSESFTGIIQYTNVNKISLKNTTGSFNASLPLKYSTDTLAANKLVRLVSESYKVGYVKADQDSVIAYQELRQDGFHVPNISSRVVLTGSPSIPSSFTEGATVTQSGGFSGVLYKATSSELLFKSHSGSFVTTQNAGVPHTDAANRIAASAISAFSGTDISIGNAVEFHTIPTSDDVVITSTNAIDAITEIQDDIGEITSLGTTDKSDIVSSINEIETAARGSNSDYTLSTTAQNFRDAIREHETDIGNMTFTGLSGTDISAALRELRTELGNHASLGTTHTADAVGAINELETAVRGSAGNYTIGTNANDLVAAINEIETVLRAGNTDYTLTTTAQNVRDAIREHETDIGNMTFTGLTANNISAALRELRVELGDHSTINNAAGYSATDASAGIVELQGAAGNYNNLTTSATNFTLAINELDLKQGSATLGTDATTLSGAINEIETAARGTNGNYTLSTNSSNFKDAINELEVGIRGTSNNLVATDLTTVSNDLVGAINEHETQINTLDTNHLNKNLAGGTNQNITGTITFTGDSVDFSNTTALFSAAGGVANFGSAFVNLNATAASGSNVNIQGLQVDRTSLTGSNPKHDVRLLWNETLVNSTPERAWQLRGMADDKSDNTADIVTFYNAKDLFDNNVENNIVVSWDAINQNFDINPRDFVVQLSGDVAGSATVTNLGDINITTTVQANSVALGTDTTGNYIASVVGTTNEVTVSGNTGDDGRSITVGLPNSVAISGEMEAGSLDINGNADISGNLVTHGNLNVNGNTTLGNGSSDTVAIPGNLTITGDLTVNGTQTTLSTATLEVEDTLILVGSDLGNTNEPTSGGFGLETRTFSGLANAVINQGGGNRTWSSAGTHPTAAAGVSGSHSIVYNFGTDRWEMDGSPLLSDATQGSPGIEVNGTDVANLSGTKTLDLKAGSGITLGSVVNGDDIEVTITNALDGYSGWFLTVDGTDRGNIADDERVSFAVGNALGVSYNSTNNVIEFSHDNTSNLSGNYGGANNGIVIEDITVDANGHVTNIDSIDLDGRFVQETETSSAAVTENKVVRTNSNGHIQATRFNGPLTGAVTGNVTGNVSGSSGSTTGNAASASTLYVTSNDTDGTFREMTWIVGSGGGNSQFYADAGLTYQSSTNTVKATNFQGNASTSSQVYVTGTSSNASYRLIFGETNDGVNGYETLYKDTAAHLYYNPSTNTLTTVNFQGNLLGNALTASQVYVTETDSNTNYAIVGCAKGDNQNGHEALYADNAIYYNASSNTLVCTNFSGNASTATKLYTTATNTNHTYKPTLSYQYANGYQDHYVDDNFSYNAATNTLTAVTFSGALSGNASTATSATSATNATNATKVYVNDYNGTTTMRILGSHDGIGSHGNVYSTSPVYINMSTNAVYATTFVGALSGHATTAGTITSQANSATTAHTSANTGNRIVSRNASGNFSAGTITATLSGNATTATNIRVVQRTTENVNYHILGVAAAIGGTSKMVNGHGSFYWNGNQARLYAPNITAGLASCTGYAYGNLTGTPFIPTHTSHLTNNSGFVTSSGFVNGNALSATTGSFSSTVTTTLLRSTGDIVAYYSSDERLKDNVQVIDGALEKVSKLRGVEFDWNDKQDVYEGHDIGVIAQDVEVVAPELVQTREDGFKAVKYEKLTALLIEAVKELTEQNKEMKAEIESLKSINSL